MKKHTVQLNGDFLSFVSKKDIPSKLKELAILELYQEKKYLVVRPQNF